MKAETLAQLLLNNPHTGELLAIAASINEAQAPSVLTAMIAAAYRSRTFSAEGQALDLVGAVIENHAAGVYADLSIDPTPHADAYMWRWRHLDAVNLAALLCLVVCCYLERRYMGATQIKLITRDCEQLIAAGNV